jgi:hypothetical protein
MGNNKHRRLFLFVLVILVFYLTLLKQASTASARQSGARFSLILVPCHVALPVIASQLTPNAIFTSQLRLRTVTTLVKKLRSKRNHIILTLINLYALMVQYLRENVLL